MILFIAPDPTRTKERDGYLQRIAAIDELFPKQKKVYIEDFDETLVAVKLMAQADVIYVHSIYQSEKIIRSYPVLADKLITDLHGAVPEELTQLESANEDVVTKMAEIEKLVFSVGKYFVAVSQAMATHYTEKYKLSTKTKWIILPVFETKTANKRTEISQTVIYAGGTQPWQNVELMIKAINTAPASYKYVILTPNPTAFQGINNDRQQSVIIKSVSNEKVVNWYASATFGFILRDDIVVNRVSCPTKLIEYLSYGVIPIVLSPNIGDFQDNGYSYVPLRTFLESKIEQGFIKSAIDNNYNIVKKLNAQVAHGERRLKELVGRLHRNKQTKYETQLLENILYLHFDNKALSQTLDLRINDIEYYKQQIFNEKKLVEYYSQENKTYQKTIQEIINSKRWRALQLGSTVIHLGRKSKHK